MLALQFFSGKELLVQDFHTIVNVEDGTQPIHGACSLANAEIISILVRAGARIDSKVQKDILSKYFKDIENDAIILVKKLLY